MRKYDLLGEGNKQAQTYSCPLTCLAVTVLTLNSGTVICKYSCAENLTCRRAVQLAG